jgi:sugar phosphate isomerase/epimerase
MIRLSAFADEIAAGLDEQVAVLLDEGIRHLDLRGVWGRNVLDLDDAQVADVRRTLAERGIQVSAIGSPIGKVPIDSPFDAHLARFSHAVHLAHIFETPYIRIFSFYPPDAEPTADPGTWRDEVLRRLRELTAQARAGGLTLLHENEKEIYGDTIARCVDLLHSIEDPHFMAILDPANFIQCAQTPYPDSYEALRHWIRYVHVKDAREDGAVVVPGEGLSRWPDLLARLRADGYNGFFSLEPHLEAAGRYAGYSGPDRFRQASQALQTLLRTIGWEFV